MNGFERRREKKRQSILRASYDLFSARGIKDVSIAEIAKKAEVSQVSIYNFFQSKENLVRQAIFAFMDEQMKESEMLLASDIPFREKMEKLFFVTAGAEDKYNQELFQSAAMSDPKILSLVMEYYQNRTEPFILNLVEQGKKEGCINPDLSIEAVRRYILAIRDVLGQAGLSKKVRVDLGALFFYGLQGKAEDRE